MATEKLRSSNRLPSPNNPYGSHAVRAQSPQEIATQKVATGKSRSQQYPKRSSRPSNQRPEPGSSFLAILPWILLALMTVGLGSGGYYMFEKYQLSQDELAEARAAGEAARHQIVALDQKIMSLEAELSHTRGEFKAARVHADDQSSSAPASAGSAPRSEP